ncbi:MAG: YjjG family noncanonical pyrimidine nucleotidase [Paramuribaculum sp.]|nr:YjjG family noncanonical pyrimidine nucleotidase [Paramuribaculum sp.]
MKSDKITTVWLDLDDTLIDFTTNAAAALSRMWHEQDVLQRLFPSAEHWALRYEHHNQALWAQYSRAEIERDYLRMERFRRPLVEAGMPDTEARRLSTAYDPYYLDLLAQGKALMPGAIELLEWLHAHSYTIGIISNGFKEVQHRKIHNAGLEPYIDIIVLSDDIGINKPDPRIYKYAMERAGQPDPSTHLIIGDNPDTDISGALASDWKAIWYLPQRAADSLSERCPAGATLVRTLQEIPHLLQSA